MCVVSFSCSFQIICSDDSGFLYCVQSWQALLQLYFHTEFNLMTLCYHCSECSEWLSLASLRAFESPILGLLLDAMSYFHVTVKSCLSTIPFTAHCTVTGYRRVGVAYVKTLNFSCLSLRVSIVLNLQSYAFSSLYGQLYLQESARLNFTHTQREIASSLSIFCTRFKNLGTPFATTFLTYKALKLADRVGSAMKKSLVTDSAGWCFSVYSASTRI